jgi:multisubunit Na+/H+ antiporter MnhB subunit
MKWTAVLGIAALLALMAAYEWPKTKRKKEKTAFAVIAVLGGLLASWLVFYPETPGPTQCLDALYKPLVKMIENLTQEGSG